MSLNFKTYIKLKKYFFLQLFGGLCFCFLFFIVGQVHAAEETRTISNFILQDTATRTTGTQTDQTFTFIMTDEIVDVKNAFFDISGIAGAAGSVTLDLSLDDDKSDSTYDFDESTAKSYTLDSTGGPTPFHLIYNVTSIMGASGNKCYVNSRGTRNCVISFKNTNASVYGLTIKLVVTYRFTKASSAAAEETRTISNFILQDTATRTSGSHGDLDNNTFTFVMTDEIVDVKNAFFDISGIVGAAGSVTLDLSLDDDKSDSTYDFDESTAKSYTLDSTGGPTPFHLIYNVTSIMGASGNKCYISTRGTYNCILSFKNTGASVYALSIKSVVTYRFKPPSSGGNIPASGTYTSPTYDSKVASDDAGGTVSKSGFNTIRWIEDVSGGTGTLVKSITIAVNNDNATWNYYGGDGTSNETACEGSNTCYSRSNATQSTDKLYCSSTSLGANRYEILCRIAPAQQNFRYFRYKIKLCNEKTSPSQCSGGNGSFTSKVEKVILNWSP